MTKLSQVILAAVLAFCWSSSALGQIPGGQNELIRVYGDPGNPKMRVYVWGQAQTGLWSVDEGTDLLDFASVVTAGGLRANRPEIETTMVLELYREGEQNEEPLYAESVEEIFSSRSYPELRDGDILVLRERTRRRFTWREISSVIGTISSTIGLVLLIDRLRRD